MHRCIPWRDTWQSRHPSRCSSWYHTSREESGPYNTLVSGLEALVEVLESSEVEVVAAVGGLFDAEAVAAVVVSSAVMALAEMTG